MAVDQLIERLEARREASVKRREFLARQKWTESASEDTVSVLRQVAAALSGQGPAQAAAQALLQTFIDTMLPSASEFDMVDGDTVSDGSDGNSASDPTDLEAGEDVEEDGQDRGGSSETRLAEARQELARVEKEREEALGRARAWTAKSCKRNSSGDELRHQDFEGDEEMVPPLMPEQVDVVFKGRLEAASKEVRRLSRMVNTRETPTLHGGGGRPTAVVASAQVAPTPAAFVELAEGAAAITQEVSAAAQRQRDEERRDSHIAFQERMQRQQEKEMVQAQLVALHKKDIEEAIRERQRRQRAPTPEAVARTLAAAAPSPGSCGLAMELDHDDGGRAEPTRPRARAQSEDAPRGARRRRTRWSPEHERDDERGAAEPPRSRSPTR